MPHRNTTHKNIDFESYPYTPGGQIYRRERVMQDPKGLEFADEMKQLSSEIRDTSMLEDLGRASVQIVHDLKNQLNGLKLYATFLRKRMEKGERPADERETIAKLIAGLERAATDMTTLVRYGRPIELHKQTAVALDQILSSINSVEETAEQIELEIEDPALAGDFDVAALSEALQAITRGALNMRRNGTPLKIQLRKDANRDTEPRALIEWQDVQIKDEDIFRSFAGSEALRMSLAARIIEAHQGTATQQANTLRVSLPIK